MFQEQIAPMRRKNTIPRGRAQLMSSLAPGHGRRARATDRDHLFHAIVITRCSNA
jgi:hypothetical protein